MFVELYGKIDRASVGGMRGRLTQERSGMDDSLAGISGDECDGHRLMASAMGCHAVNTARIDALLAGLDMLPDGEEIVRGDGRAHSIIVAAQKAIAEAARLRDLAAAIRPLDKAGIAR